MKNRLVSIMAGAAVLAFASAACAAQSTQVERVQAALDAWLAARAPVEKVTGIAAYISFGAAGPAIEAFAGKVGRDPDSTPVDQDTFYQMGSTSKSFTAAVILQLEAAGKLSIDDTLGKWLPEYAAWKDVTIRHLLDMTSGIPTYSETEWMSKAWADEPMRAFTLKELADAAYPSATNQLPVSKGYFYSNTNYVLAGMIAEKATGKSFRDLVHELVIEPHGLTSTFYEASTYPEQVIKRLSHGYSRTRPAPSTSPNAKKRGMRRSSGATCATPARPGCNPQAALFRTPAMSIAGCALCSAGRWFQRSSKRSGWSSSRPKQASRSRRCPPMIRADSPLA